MGWLTIRISFDASAGRGEWVLDGDHGVSLPLAVWGVKLAFSRGSTRNGVLFVTTGEKKQEFLDLASIARQEIPADVASDEKVIAALPAFFRAVRGRELEGERLKQFIEDLREAHSPNSDPRA